MISPLKDVNLIVAVGSVDGMAATAACLRHLQNPNVQLVFTQAFLVHKIDVSIWPARSKVGLIDLGVNNERHTENPKQLTIDFIKKIYFAGHTILFIADEHDKNSWEEVLNACGHSIGELSIRPQDRKEYSSSCAIIKEALGESADIHTRALLHAGDEADKMNFDTPLGTIFNNCTKSNMGDPYRRPHVVRHLSLYDQPDEKIIFWMNEYVEILENQPKILSTGQDIGYGIFLYDVTSDRHDATSIFKEAYKKSSIAILKGRNVVSIGTCLLDFNVLRIVQKAGVKAGGMAAKANCAISEQNKAIDAVRREYARRLAIKP